MSVEVTQAGARDAAIVARLHAVSWQASYRGILPERFLDQEVGVERAAYWSRALAAGDYALVLLARVDGAPAAFIAIKRATEAGYDATIEHLHVLSVWQGRGLGRRLMADAVETLIGRGATSVCLRVFDDNAAAIDFYRGLGGVTDEFGVDRLAGGEAPDRRMGWRDLPALVRACRGEVAR